MPMGAKVLGFAGIAIGVLLTALGVIGTNLSVIGSGLTLAIVGGMAAKAL